MKITRIINFDKYRIYRDLKGNSLFFVFLFLFFGSFIIGIVFIGNGQTSGILDKIFDFYINSHSSELSFKSLFDVFAFAYIFLIFAGASGLSVLGIVFIPTVIFIRGLALGMILGRIYSEFMISGVVFNIIVIALPLTISVILLLEISVKAMNFSYYFGKCFLGIHESECPYGHKIFISGFAYITVVSIFIAFFEATLSKVFLNFFSLG